MNQLLLASAAFAGVIPAIAGDAVGSGQTTNALSFGGFPGGYTYQRAAVVNYNNGNPSCPLQDVTTDGPLAPLTDEMSHIFRGPLNLLQFAVYQASTTQPNTNMKRDTKGKPHTRRHSHDIKRVNHHHHGKELGGQVEKRGYGTEVIATIDGKVDSFEDNWYTPATSAPAPASDLEITATINGNVVSFADTWNNPAAPVETVTNMAAASASPSAKSQAIVSAISSALKSAVIASASADKQSTTSGGLVYSEVNNGRTTYSSAVSTSCSSSNVPSPTAASSSVYTQSSGDGPSAGFSGSGSWPRVAYFDAPSQTNNGIAFTANNNMTIEAFGFLPGWVASNGAYKAEGPSMLGSSGFIPDNYEVIVSTDSLCSSSDNEGGCSVVTPGAIAHHGWGGDRVVLAEFQMPQSKCGSYCTNQFIGMAENTNLPAWWSLASTTINIGQYGFSFSGDCTGWSNGAGELDVIEILPGNEPPSIGYASLHMNGHYSGTPPKGFPRPDGAASMKMALIVSGDQVHIQVLGSWVDFDTALDAATVNTWLAGNSTAPMTSGGDGGVPGGARFKQGASPAYVADVASASFNVILG